LQAQKTTNRLRYGDPCHFSVHGFWPEAAAAFSGLKNIESISDDEIACRTPDESAFILLHGCRPEQTKLTERTTRSFTTHSLKTTIILEPEGVQWRVVK